MTLHNEIINLPARYTSEVAWDACDTDKVRIAYKEGHRDARHAAAELADAHEAAQREHDKESLSIILWLLRRLPRCYENPPHVVQEMMRLSYTAGIDCSDALNERIEK